MPVASLDAPASADAYAALSRPCRSPTRLGADFGRAIRRIAAPGLQPGVGQLLANDLKQGHCPATLGQLFFERPQGAGIEQVAHMGQANKVLPTDPVQEGVFHLFVREVAVQLLEHHDLE